MIPVQLSPTRLAAAIAERLDTVVPHGLSVHAEGTIVGIADPEWWGGSAAAEIVTDNDDRTPIERLECAAVAILNTIQDEVMESTKEQWPMGPLGVGNPSVRVSGDRLDLWFGSESDPVLRLASIQLVEIAHGPAHP